MLVLLKKWWSAFLKVIIFVGTNIWYLCGLALKTQNFVLENISRMYYWALKCWPCNINVPFLLFRVMLVTSKTCKTLIGVHVHKIQGWLYPKKGLATVLLAHDPLSSSAYPMITHTTLIASNLPVQILVVRRWPTKLILVHEKCAINHNYK